MLDSSDRDLPSELEPSGWQRVVERAGLEAVVTMDPEGRVVDWSAEAESLFGYSREEALNRLMASLIVPQQYRDAHWAGLERFRATGQARILNRRLELSAIRRDGTEFPIELTVTLLRLGDRPLFAAFIRELPQTLAAEERRTRAALESRLLQQVATLSAFAGSFDDALARCVESMCTVTGWPVGHVFAPDDEGGHLVSTDIWHVADDDRYAAIREISRDMRLRRGEGLPGRVWETGEAVWSANVQQDNRFVRAAGKDLGIRGAFGFPVSVNGEPVAVLEFFTPEEIAPDPQLLMLVSSIGTQLGRIMERRQWEDERARLAAIVDSSYDAIIGKSLDGTIISWNKGAEQTYGFTANDAIGRPISIILPEGRSEEEDEILQAVRTGRQLLQFEARRRRKDGAELIIALTVSPIRDSKGRIVGSSTIERDITQRKLREQELEAAKAAAEAARQVAEAANQTKTEFLANISHELRTPMNAIIGMLDLSLGEELSPVMEEYLRTARDSAHTLLYLLDDLLDFSRMEIGRFEIEAEPFNPREVLDGLVKTLSLRANEKGLELAVRIDADVPQRLLGDGKRLRQVLMNLAGNAIKFTEQGEVLVSAAVQSRTEETVTLLFSVKDTGIGISPRDQSKLFAPFTQVDSSITRRYTGSGLGLAICRELVQRMDGRIWFKSIPNAGSTFSFTARFDVLPDQPQSGWQVERFHGLPVLIVDDNETNLSILRETLANWNMNPTLATNGRTGLQWLREAEKRGDPFAVVIVDALMPDLDGFTFIETMEEEGLTSTRPVLMLSAADRQTFQTRCNELPVNVFLEKPVSQSDLLEAVNEACFGVEPELPDTPRIPQTVRPLRVLLAEDTPANQKVVRAMLEKRGHHVVIANNGREAIQHLRQSSFDVVLMDVQMPTMDGLQATEAIRELADPRKAAVPIIAMTAHARRQDRQRCRAVGMDAYISKPIDQQRLVHLVETTRHHPSGTSLAQWTSDPQMDVFNPDVESVDFQRPVGNVHRLIDRHAALRRLGGNEELFSSLAQIFVDDSPQLIDQLRAAVDHGDAHRVERAAHSLRGLAANFDAHRVVEIAGRIEQFGRAHRLQDAAMLVPELVSCLEQVQSELKPYL